MAKQKTASYLSPRKLLSPEEYAEYKRQQQEPRRAELQEKLKQGAKNIKRFEVQRRYATSRTGRFSGFLQRNIQRAQRPQPVAAALYEQSIPITSKNVQQEYPTMPRTVRGSSGGKVGRPRQTYDKRYAAYGGVYGYRKMLAAKLRAQKFELIRQNTISPQQQMVMNQLASQQAYAQQNPENKAIPDTYGQVRTRGIMDEIDFAANLVP